MANNLKEVTFFSLKSTRFLVTMTLYILNLHTSHAQSSDQALILVNGSSTHLEVRPEFREDLTRMYHKSISRNVSIRRLDFGRKSDLNNSNLLEEIDDMVSDLSYRGNLVVYFTDHGSRNEKTQESSVVIGNTLLTQSQYNQFLKKLTYHRKDIRIISVFDTCYSGGMLNNMVHQKFPDRICGFAASHENEIAYDNESIAQALYKSKFTNIASMIESQLNEKSLASYDTTSSVFLKTYLKNLKNSKSVYSKSSEGINKSIEHIIQQSKNQCNVNNNNNFTFLKDFKNNIDFSLALQKEKNYYNILKKKITKKNDKEMLEDTDNFDKNISLIKKSILQKEQKFNQLLEKATIEFMSTQWPKYKQYYNCFYSTKPCNKEIQDQLYEDFLIYKKNHFNDYNSPVIQKANDVAISVIEEKKRYSSLVKFSDQTKKLQALQAMYSNNDQESLKKFLGLRECEYSNILKK